ncbi:FkbM family methyltransferase [Cyanobium sp. ULC084]
MHSIIRAVQLVVRILESTNQLGFADTLAVFSYLLNIKKIRYIRLCERKFYFSPLLDKGVISHFYEVGYKIEGNPELIIDVGANIGDETIRFRHFHPAANVIAIEPSVRNVAFLKRNFQDDPLTTIIEGALWHTTTTLELNPGSGNEACFVDILKSPTTSVGNNKNTSVNAFSVNDVLRICGMTDSQIDIFKIDVEGAEECIFCDGDTSWLSNVNVIIMELPDNDRPKSFQKIVMCLRDYMVDASYYICGENVVIIRESSGFTLRKVVGLNR